MVSVLVASAYRKGSKGFQAAKPQRLPYSVPKRTPIGRPANDNIPLPKPANDNVPPLPVQIADMFGNARYYNAQLTVCCECIMSKSPGSWLGLSRRALPAIP